MNILGIESSCDETACAVVKDGREVLSNVVYTQIPLHQPYGGVVPEVASRAHIEKIHGVVAEAMKAGVPIDAVAVTYGPGLASSLLVGLNAAKGLAMSLGVPLIGINHIEAHLHTPFLFDAGETNPQAVEQSIPALGLAVSGGHTTWVDMPSYGEYRIIGQTLDDAAGEAFDKAAKLLGLGYPGGPVIDRWAKGYWNGMTDFSDAAALKALKYPDGIKVRDPMPRFPKGQPRAGTAALAGLDAELCVSFSGLKTALLYYVKKNPPKDDCEKAALVAAYQEAIVGTLANRTRLALRRRDYKALIVGGGVSLNGRLRAKLAEVAADAHVPLLLAKPKYCGDNAAMIAGLAYYRRNLVGDAALKVDVNPALQAGD
ncbi:MAG: tRNA (adenosine(37)-N6)-threonylcarbamoyltransferase complex transferase subunit TsaD [bacterium]|nr:tRNA (adenosine(37)-N6)-threonylcarbamoyltransferase complex transferase subunit TsaD [bacterium]